MLALQFQDLFPSLETAFNDEEAIAVHVPSHIDTFFPAQESFNWAHPPKSMFDAKFLHDIFKLSEVKGVNGRAVLKYAMRSIELSVVPSSTGPSFEQDIMLLPGDSSSMWVQGNSKAIPYFEEDDHPKRRSNKASERKERCTCKYDDASIAKDSNEEKTNVTEFLEKFTAIDETTDAHTHDTFLGTAHAAAAEGVLSLVAAEAVIQAAAAEGVSRLIAAATGKSAADSTATEDEKKKKGPAVSVFFWNRLIHDIVEKGDKTATLNSGKAAPVQGTVAPVRNLASCWRDQESGEIVSLLHALVDMVRVCARDLPHPHAFQIPCILRGLWGINDRSHERCLAGRPQGI